MKKPPSLRVHTLILGGGLSGLSAACHLEKAGFTDYLLVEKNSFFGGLCASEEINGFTFDLSGHLLHLHDPYAKTLVRQLLGKNMHRLQRRAFIDMAETLVPYPFQANLWALPPEIKQECLLGAQQAARTRGKRNPADFRQWCLQAFGEGVYRRFMRPYNTKLWQTEPDNLTWDWCGDFVPEPDLRQIRAGAEKPPKKSYGYNVRFYYPLRGGCGALAQALANRVPNAWLNAELQSVDFKRRIARVNGKEIRFERLLNTLPLKEFVMRCRPPASVRAAAEGLRCTTVRVLNFAVNRPVSGVHWIYLPQKDTPFYRLGVMSAFSPHNAPQGTSSFYAETAENIPNELAAEETFFNLLRQKGIINKSDEILFSFWRRIPVAYAVYDRRRAALTDKILSWLQKRRCLCAGRYGRWEYSFMERSLLQGRDAAAELLKR